MLDAKYFCCILFVCLSIVLTIGNCNKLPSSIKPCSLSSSDLSSCLRKTAQSSLKIMADGIPALGVLGIDPISIDDIISNEPSIKIAFREAKSNGLKDAIINELNIDFQKKRIYLNVVKNGSISGQYKIDGKVLVIPIKGEGTANILFTMLNYIFIMDYEVYKGPDGKDHWKITKHEMTYTADKVEFHLANLFNGNKALSETTHKVVNENWKSIFADLSPSMMSKGAKGIVTIINSFFAAVPVEDMFIP